jgi:hypothetical protein
MAEVMAGGASIVHRVATRISPGVARFKLL